MSRSAFRKLGDFTRRVDREDIHWTLASHRDGAVMVQVTVPGARWEAEFFEDGSVEVERFVSDGAICGEEVLKELFTRFGEPRPATTSAS